APALAHLRPVLHDESPGRGQRPRPVGLVRHRRPARRTAVRGEPAGGRRDLRRRAAGGGAGLSVRRAARRALLAVTLLVATGCAGVGGPVPGAPPHHRAHGFASPRRLNPPGIAFEALPPIDVVVISHDHYDHLDRPSVQRLAATHKPLFLVPLGLKAWFASLGIDRVTELDWWDSHRVGAVTFTLTPVQHWCARTPFDMDRRLWGGWAIAGRERRLFFGGDT